MYSVHVGMRLCDGIDEKLTVMENVMKQILNEIMAFARYESAHSKNYYRYDLCYNEMNEKKTPREKKRKKITDYVRRYLHTVDGYIESTKYARTHGHTVTHETPCPMAECISVRGLTSVCVC